jgi:hypothetical protein
MIGLGRRGGLPKKLRILIGLLLKRREGCAQVGVVAHWMWRHVDMTKYSGHVRVTAIKC